MGQYYKPVLKKQNGNYEVFSRYLLKKRERDYTLAKLLEHSWFPNDYVNSLVGYIEHLGKVRLAWVGDYACDKVWQQRKTIPILNSEIEKFYKIAWNPKISEIDLDIKTYSSLEGKAILNHDTKEYLDCDIYFESSTDKHGWTIHPLPLLTALGNGLGGGDYHEKFPNFDKVGFWANNLIEITSLDKVPEEYNRFDIYFKEEQ